MLKEMIFWGAVGHAKVLRECMSRCNLQLAALFDNDKNRTSPFEDVPLYHGTKGFEEWMQSRDSSDPIGFLVTIGGDRGKDRVAIQQYLESHGLVALTAKHPTA